MHLQHLLRVTNLFFSPPPNTEIRRKLFSASNTSPGPDRVEHRHLKLVDPSCSILHLLFKHIFKKRDVPQAWKSAVTDLIHKKGSTDDLSNFRPIALMSCLYKLVMGIIAKRRTTWAIDNNLLSDEQKSARPSVGCYEHTLATKMSLSPWLIFEMLSEAFLIPQLQPHCHI